MDRHPDVWFRHKAQKLWKNAIEAAAEFVNADSDDVVFVQNATTGIHKFGKVRIIKSQRNEINEKMATGY